MVNVQKLSNGTYAISVGDGDNKVVRQLTEAEYLRVLNGDKDIKHINNGKNDRKRK